MKKINIPCLLLVAISFLLNQPIQAQYLDLRHEIEAEQVFYQQAKVKEMRSYISYKHLKLKASEVTNDLRLTAISYFDEAGRLIKKNSFDEQGAVSMYTLYTYNDSDQLTKMAENELDGNESFSWLWKYDDQGHLIKKDFYMSGELAGEVSYIYNDKGIIIESKEPGAEPRWNTYYYDDKGQLIEVVGKTVYFVDEIESWETIDAFQYTYNEQNRMTVKKECYGNAGCTQENFNYDEQGRLSQVMSKSEYNELTHVFHYEAGAKLPMACDALTAEAYQEEEPNYYFYYRYEYY